MIKKYLSIALIGLLVFGASSNLVFAQSSQDDSRIAKVKSSVRKRGTSGKERVLVKMLTGTKLKGHITQADENSFTLSDGGQSQVIAYRDVAKVGSSGLSKGAKIGIFVGAAAAATGLILFASFLNAVKNS